ncbi:MAG: aldo/keto reductase [Bacteroidales bacterium]|jgi:diketogulonate reductase-like aldo/keto reductase|nr:aldo/keto reductase [Bacteroidales bacterium]MCI1785971.1 aldo/keto reductase [Bacteroidales bacterium]
METVKLNNGVEMPVIGLGTFKANDPDECEQGVVDALEVGYRMIDTAQSYGNEEYIGKALKRSGVKRADIFLTTKVWFRNFENARASVEESMRRLGTDYLDLVLLHWPFGNTYAAYRDLEKMLKEGSVRAIGVSNFNPDRLIDIIEYNEVVPAVDQIETNLAAQQLEAHEWLVKYGVQHEGYSPFGRGRMDGIYDNPVLVSIAEKYNKTPRQITLKYQLQCGVVIIPKSVHKARIIENLDLFDFSLDSGDMAALKGLDRNAPMTGTPQNPETVIRSLYW